MNWPAYAPYREQLLPVGPDGKHPLEDVEQPHNRDDAFSLLHQLDQLLHTDPEAWRLLYRKYTATNWYVLGLLLSGGRRINPYTGRVELDCDFLWNYMHEAQLNGHGYLDTSARQHFKSFGRNYVGATNAALVDENIAIALIAHDRQAAAKHGQRTMMEWETNLELCAAWSDRFWDDPVKESPSWSKESGCTIKRTIPGVLPTLSWWGIAQPPTGGRVGLFILDDLENEQTVETDEMRAKTLTRYASFLELAGRMPVIWANGTYHHTAGLVKHMADSGAWRVRCHKAEDVDEPAPDIAALYDACGGKRPDGQEIPPEVRNIKLDGAATYLHPLELAEKRLNAMATPDGLAQYYAQNMGDPLAGRSNKLNPDLIRWYNESPEERAEGSVLVLTIDASRGVNDSTFAMLWALHTDRSISWVAALRRRLAPSEIGPAFFRMHAEWEGIASFDHFRVEIFGQAVWDWMIESYFEERKKWVKVVPIGRNRENRIREYQAIEPLLKAGRVYFPKCGLMVYDEMGTRYDAVKYFLEKELSQFPLPITDDGLGSMALLGEPADAKISGGKGFVGELPFPETSEELRTRLRSGGYDTPYREEAWDAPGACYWEVGN